ncbi:MAG: hypothetical protein WCG26_06725 [Chloroflexales bacterium]
MKRLPMRGEYADHLTRGGRRVHGNNHQVRGKLKRRYRRRARRETTTTRRASGDGSQECATASNCATYPSVRCCAGTGTTNGTISAR